MASHPGQPVATGLPATFGPIGSPWLAMKTFSEVAEIGPRAAQKAAASCYNGGKWRGVQLQARYEGTELQVYAPSLPADLRDIWHARYKTAHAVQFPAPLNIPCADSYTDSVARNYALQCWRIDLIAPALRFPKGSRGRSETLREIAGRIVTKPNGKAWRPSVSTLQNWLKITEEDGPQALKRKPRTENAPRVLVSRQWDAACSLEPAAKQEIAASIASHIRSLWASGAPGWYRVRQLSSVELLDQCRRAGWADATLAECTPGRALVEKFRRFSLVAIKDNHAKLWADQYTPRIQRTREGLQPGQIVIGDVHPMDVVREIDGRRVHARLISWLDLATYDLFVTVIILPKGRGIRQEDVTASFVDMINTWGLPQHLRLDHGMEFKWDAMIQGFQTLAALVENFNAFTASLLGKGEAADFMDSERFPAVSRARPYNAPAKQIEHVFGLVEQSFFAMMPGWIGGDRMNKRTQMQGADPVSHDGRDEEFQRDIDACLSLYRATPQADGSSPNQKREKAIAEGWKGVRVSLNDLLFAFSERESVKVKNSGIAYRGRWYFADILVPLVGHRIEIMAAKWAPGAIFHNVAGAMVAIPEAIPYGQQDGAGAKEQGRRAGLALLNVRQMKAQTHPVDLMAEARRTVAALPPAPAVPFGPTITTAGGEAIAGALADMAAPAAVKLLTGEFRHPTDGHIVKLKPPNENGPKPAAAAFDPLKFAPPTPVAQTPSPTKQGFDLLKSLQPPSQKE